MFSNQLTLIRGSRGGNWPQNIIKGSWECHRIGYTGTVAKKIFDAAIHPLGSDRLFLGQQKCAGQSCFLQFHR